MNIATAPGALAREKLTRIFGPARAEALLAQLLGELGISELTTLEELGRFAKLLEARGGFESAVGAALSVQILMHQIQQPK
jgi:hypothetical protein